MAKSFTKFVGLIALSAVFSSCSTSNTKSVEKVYLNSSKELVVLYNDGTEDNLGVIKGEDGKDGTNGKDGSNGKDGNNGENGKTPYIGENGNWWIGETDTGVLAGGPTKKATSLSFNSTNDFEYYLPNNRLNLEVRLNYDDGSSKALNSNEYIIEDNIAFKKVGSYSTTVSLASNSNIKATLNYNVVPRKNFKVLFIGNSFSQCTVSKMPTLSSALGMNVEAVNMYIAGCSIDKHYNNIVNNASTYRKETYENNAWKYTENTSLNDVIASEKWDYIFFQQASNYSGLESSYSNLYNLANKVKENLNAEAKNYTQFVFNMTWAYQSNIGDLTASYGPIFETNYHSDQKFMYDSIISCAQKLDSSVFDIVIPNGTAVQNMRTSSMGDTITSDGFHLYNAHGGYLLAATTLKSLSGINLNTLVTSSSEKYKQIAIESANNAYENPYEVTESEFVEDDEKIESIDLAKYDKMTLTFKNGEYYFNKENSANVTLKWGNFICTQVFEKSDIPIGSIIAIEEGYQYRADCWYNKNEPIPSTESRRDNVKEHYTKVTNTWFGEYNFVGFNISRVDGTSLSSNYAAAQNAFNIYVPKSN